MSSPRPASAANRLLAALPRQDRKRFLAGCKPVDGGASMEVELVGDEGMLGISLILGVDISPLHALVQGGGPVLRMDAAPFRRELGLSLALQRGLNRYLYVLMGQLAQTAACTRFHVVEGHLEDPAAASGPLPKVLSGNGPRSAIPYLTRMSFLTDFTPPTPRVTSTALFAAVCELTKPLS